MASVFTFEHEPPRVSSLWPERVLRAGDHNSALEMCAGMRMPRAETLSNFGIMKVDPEPQEGPVEYKLHLLLRPRRNYTSCSTSETVTGSHLSKSRSQRAQSESNIKTAATIPILAPSNQSRQNRLQHLTTQLLWRLQQSSPFHSSSKSTLILPILPSADIERSMSMGPGPLLPGLEESGGAIYEIGVRDDGSFVGLVKDELEESFKVLRAMAFSLGCDVEILHLVKVGDCHWSEETSREGKVANQSRVESLWVAEALVCPQFGPHSQELDEINRPSSSPNRQQLRVSLTGSTTSGKSTLLGTLSTSTLDNGRGKSRLSLLKHRHEIVSGVTSSLAQELFGYNETKSDKSSKTQTNLINYASVFVTDSAGHPRYRRTTVRGIVSWAPHWALCCIAADNEEDSSGKVGATSKPSDILGSSAEGVDLSKAHLELCLKLHLPVVVVITKLDIATKTGLRTTLAKVLTILKAAGRKPDILKTSPSRPDEADMQVISKEDENEAMRKINSVEHHEMHLLVPIVLTSALRGIGINALHALLYRLPLLANDLDFNADSMSIPETIFHVDEDFAVPQNTHHSDKQAAIAGRILSGYVQHGTLEVGQTLLIGPCSPELFNESYRIPEIPRAKSFPGLGKVASQVKLLPDENHFLIDKGVNTTKRQEDRDQQPLSHLWHDVRITSIRNLRMPVQKLVAGQVGTIGVNLFGAALRTNVSSSASFEVRRGMVLASHLTDYDNGRPPAYKRFRAVFDQAGLPARPGVRVIVYIASIRAQAKIVEVTALEATDAASDVFDLDDVVDRAIECVTSENARENDRTEIEFEFTASAEWFAVGCQVLVTPGGGPSLTGQPEQREIGSAGLDGYVGIITHATNVF